MAILDTDYHNHIIPMKTVLGAAVHQPLIAIAWLVIFLASCEDKKMQ